MKRICVIALIVFLSVPFAYSNSIPIDDFIRSFLSSVGNTNNADNVDTLEKLREIKTSFVYTTYNYDDIKACKKLSVLKLRDITSSKFSETCDSLGEMKKEVALVNGNVLLINSVYSGCDLVKYKPIAYFCDDLRQFKDSLP